MWLPNNEAIMVTQIRQQMRLAWHRGPHMHKDFVVDKEDVIMHKITDTVNSVLLNGLYSNS